MSGFFRLSDIVYSLFLVAGAHYLYEDIQNALSG